MHFLKCNSCGHPNEVKTEYLIFCSNCNKKLDKNFSDWQKRNPEKSLDDFKQIFCVTEEEVQRSNQAPKSKKPKSLKYWIGFVVVFALFYAIGILGGEKLAGLFRKPALDKNMTEMANEINKNCPILVDNATRLDNAIALPNKEFQYNYTLVNMVKDSINIDELKNYLEPRITNIVKTEPQMKVVRDNKITVKYSYKDKSGVFLFTISVTPEQYK